MEISQISIRHPKPCQADLSTGGASMKKQIIRATQMLQKMSLKNLKKAGTKPEIAALVVKTGIRAGRGAAIPL